MLEKVDYLEDILITIKNDEITDVEVAVKCSRTLLPLHSSGRFSYYPARIFADIFLNAHRRTNRLDYLNEAMIAYRDLRKLSAPKEMRSKAGLWLIDCFLYAGIHYIP